MNNAQNNNGGFDIDALFNASERCPEEVAHDYLITAVRAEKKLDAFAAHESQFFEWLAWHRGFLEEFKKDPESARERLREVLTAWFYEPMREACAEQTEHWYGKKRAASIKVIEAFELCEYGHQATEDELRKLFPFHAGSKKKKG